MKLLLMLPVIVLLGACGEAGKATSAASRTSSSTSSTGSVPATTASGATPIGPYKDSNDGENDPNSNDDYVIVNYGHAASAADKRTVTTLVKEYYAAAAAADGAKACTLMYAVIVETIPEEYAESPGLRGASCAAVMSNMFRQRHGQMAADHAALKVTRVRVEANKGLVLVYVGKIPESNVVVHREHGAWKIQSLFETGMP
jgi:hypothetical protein